MGRKHTSGRQAIVLASGLVGLASGAVAQGIVSTNGTIIAAGGTVSPDSAGMPSASQTFNTGFALDTPALDDNGNVIFRGRFTDSVTPVTTFDDRAYFTGSSSSNLAMLVRGADQAPGMATGILLRTVTGSSSSLTSSPELSPDGRALWSSNIVDSTATGLVTSGVDDYVWIGGPIGSQTVLLRRGDAAPGTVGAAFVNSSFSGQNQGINRQGRIYIYASLTGGDTTTTVGMNNQQALYAGFPGALDLVQRKSSPVAAIPGEFTIDSASTMTFATQMNDSGQLFYDMKLSITQGSAVAANDQTVMIFTPGAGSQLLVREGDVAPGTMGATFANGSGTWSAGVSGNVFNRNGLAAFNTSLVGGDVTGTTDDGAIYVGGVGSLTMMVREGSAAPGTDATFGVFNNSSLQMNNNNRIAFQGSLTGGTSTTADDTGVWTNHGGTLQLVVREGQVMPGTGGSVASSFSGTTMYFNDAGQILFTTSLSGGTLTSSSWWAWDAGQGLIPVLLPGDSFEIAPGVFRFWTGSASSAGSQTNNDSRSLSFAHDGRFTFRLGVNDGLVPPTSSDLIVVGHIAANTPVTPYCFGDGSSTACPCGNSGVSGNGCANSVNANGANLAGIGVASIGFDTFTLNGTGMPNSSALYFQGTSALAPAVAFGDGLRCAGGSVIRLKTVFNVAGASQYPEAGDPSVSVRGLCAAGDLRFYQVWYRNAAAFCTSSTFNLSNGVSVTWVP
jgi:hypothetical protein